MLHQFRQRLSCAAMLLTLGAAAGMLYGALGIAGLAPDSDGAAYAYPLPTDTLVPAPPSSAYPVFLPSMVSD
jgi:hypothetical protein